MCGVSVARAFQPEICPSASDLRTGAVELQAVCLTRSREGAKGNAKGSVRCSVRRAADGSPRVCVFAALRAFGGLDAAQVPAF